VAKRLASAALFSAFLTAASAAGDPSAVNAQLTFEIGQAQGPRAEAPRIYRVVSMLDGKVQSVYGGRIPLPAVAGGGASGTYAYQNVGVTLSYATRPAEPGVLELDARIEGTLLPAEGVPPAAGTPPSLGTFTHAFRVLLESGKKVRVIDVGEAEGAGHYVDVRAEWGR
jgi:hypothetical protein